MRKWAYRKSSPLNETHVLELLNHIHSLHVVRVPDQLLIHPQLSKGTVVD